VIDGHGESRKERCVPMVPEASLPP
jgi:hypothetical protein